MKVNDIEGKRGAYQRRLLNFKERCSVIEKIRKKPEAKRSSDDWWDLGENLVINGVLKKDKKSKNEGVDALKKAINRTPASVAAHMDLAWVLMNDGAEVFAIDYLERASSLIQNSRDLFAMLAICQARLGRREAALFSINKAISSKFSVQADVLLKKNLEDNECDIEKEARKIFFRKISVEEARAANFPNSEILEIIEFEYERISTLDPLSVQSIEAKARLAYCREEFQDARNLLEKLEKTGEISSQGLTYLALIEAKERYIEKAESYYCLALEKDPGNFLAKINLGCCMADKGRFTHAKSLIESAIASYPGDDPQTLAAGLTVLGNCYGVEDGNYVKEIELHRESIKTSLYPKSPSPSNLVASLINDMQLEAAERTLTLYADHIKSLEMYDKLKMLLGLFKKAKKTPENLFELTYLILSNQLGLPINASHRLLDLSWKQYLKIPMHHREDYLVQLGQFAATAGKRDLSVKCWQVVAQISSDKTVLMNKAVDLELLGRRAEAVETLNSLPDSVLYSSERTCSMAGMIYLNTGEEDKGLTALKRGVEIDPSFSLNYQHIFSHFKGKALPVDFEYFHEALRNNQASVNNSLTLAKYEFLQGRLEESYRLIVKHFFSGSDECLPLESLQKLDTLAGQVGVSPLLNASEYHFAVKVAYLFGDLERAEKILEYLLNQPWSDGDTNVAYGSIQRRLGKAGEFGRVLIAMGNQVPPKLELAVTSIINNQPDTAASFLMEAEEGAKEKGEHSLSGFNHVECWNTHSLYLAIQAYLAESRGNDQEALELVSKAIEIDDQCLLAYEVALEITSRLGLGEMWAALYELASSKLANAVWIELKRIKHLLLQEKYDTARDLLELHKIRLKAVISPEKYTELLEIALPSKSLESGKYQTPGWIVDLGSPTKEWLIKAVGLFQYKETAEAGAFYAFKALEYHLKTIFERFKNEHVAGLKIDPIEGAQDFEKFMINGSAIALGGMSRALRLIGKTQLAEKKHPVIQQFSDFICKNYRDGSLFLMNDVAQDLMNCVLARNKLAHTSGLGREECERIQRMLLGADSRPIFFL